MRIEQLEYLAAITANGSLRRASGQLHVSQSAVSESIAKLERELGVVLLDRHRSGSRISLAGRELLQPIMDVLDSIDRLKAAAGDQLSPQRLLRVGTVNAATASLLLPAVRAFQRQHAGANVEIRNLQQEEIQQALAEGTLDLGLVNLLVGDDVSPGLQATTLLAGRPVVVVPASHPLANASEITADQLRVERFVAMRSGYLMYRFAHRLFGSRPPAEWHSTDGAEMGKMMVAEGLGLTILPDYSVVGDPMERVGIIVARPIAGDGTTVTLAALHRRQPHLPANVADLLQHLRAHANQAQTAASA